jgi:hypothetical protein
MLVEGHTLPGIPSSRSLVMSTSATPVGLPSVRHPYFPFPSVNLPLVDNLTSQVGLGHHESGFSVIEKPRDVDDGNSTSGPVACPFFHSPILKLPPRRQLNLIRFTPRDSRRPRVSPVSHIHIIVRYRSKQKKNIPVKHMLWLRQ